MPQSEITLNIHPTYEFRTVRIRGDGRCLFRSVVYGDGLRLGKPSESETLQKKLANELRSKVVDELIKRRADTEWFLDDNLDKYIRQMRQSHIWGGEPEILMASHVLKMQITVHMEEYGKEYGKENPICVLYHSYGHYDALKRPL